MAAKGMLPTPTVQDGGKATKKWREKFQNNLTAFVFNPERKICQNDQKTQIAAFGQRTKETLAGDHRQTLARERQKRKGSLLFIQLSLHFCRNQMRQWALSSPLRGSKYLFSQTEFSGTPMRKPKKDRGKIEENKLWINSKKT